MREILRLRLRMTKGAGAGDPSAVAQDDKGGPVREILRLCLRMTGGGRWSAALEEKISFLRENPLASCLRSMVKSSKECVKAVYR